eukprot:GILI01036056.1.p1 GENE.GILI01036056.1~~GILI01036056.1.p1  ORF type:complete len:120 (-),score=27.26 GILI01036056.1:33-392(-)
MKIVSKPPAPQANKMDVDEDEDDDFVKKSSGGKGRATTPESQKKNNPFRRVDAAQVEVDPRLRDNSYQPGSTDYGGKANRDLSVVKGKNFRHEKTKKKRGTYRGGKIDMAVNSIKFDED